MPGPSNWSRNSSYVQPKFKKGSFDDRFEREWREPMGITD